MEGFAEMERNTRRRHARPFSARSRAAVRLELLEDRQLLSSSSFGNTDIIPSLLYRRVEPGFPTVGVAHPIGDGPAAQTTVDNQGKIVSGTTENGEPWTITVHGPGYAIVTDTTPNDGILDSQIDSITLVGTSLNSTYVTGQVAASNRVQSDGLIGFNRLVASDGVASVVLNGFVLKQTGDQPTGPARIALLGGVRTLEITAIETNFDPNATDITPTDLIIGDPNTPLTVEPSIRIERIFNTALLADTPTVVTAITTPTVRFLVNGNLENLELGSVSGAPVPAYINATVSPVSTTGRTSVQALSVNGLKVVGGANNLTVSRAATPFSSRFSGLNGLGHAYFGGTADGIAIDASNGNIGRLKFLRGLGNPAGTSGSLLESGTPLGQRGYPWAGYSGGVIAAKSIGSTVTGPANLVRQIPSNPDNIQPYTPGSINYVTRPGVALTNATITTTGSIGSANVVGDSRNTLTATGYDYLSFLQGLDPVRTPSRIAAYRQRGDLVDSVIAASYRAGDSIYGNGNDQAGNGSITGNLNGNLYLTTGDTTNGATFTGGPRVRGAGFFARRLRGYLPSIGGPLPQAPATSAAGNPVRY